MGQYVVLLSSYLQHQGLLDANDLSQPYEPTTAKPFSDDSRTQTQSA